MIDQWNNQLFTEEPEPSIEILSREVEFGITNWMLALATSLGWSIQVPPFIYVGLSSATPEVAWLKLGHATITESLESLPRDRSGRDRESSRR